MNPVWSPDEIKMFPVVAFIAASSLMTFDPLHYWALRCSSCWARSDLQPGSPGWPSRVILGQIVQINLFEGVSQAPCCWDGWTLLFWQTTFYKRACVNAASWQRLTNAEEPVWLWKKQVHHPVSVISVFPSILIFHACFKIPLAHKNH